MADRNRPLSPLVTELAALTDEVGRIRWAFQSDDSRVEEIRRMVSRIAAVQSRVSELEALFDDAADVALSAGWCVPDELKSAWKDRHGGIVRAATRSLARSCPSIRFVEEPRRCALPEGHNGAHCYNLGGTMVPLDV